VAKFLVTGGAGFIGSNLADALVASGDRVRILDDFSSGRRENLDALASKVEVTEGSITDAATVARVMDGVDYVLHHAAIASVPKSMADPELSYRTNVDGTLTLLEAARAAGVKRLVLASSSAVYGDGDPRTPDLPRDESMPPDPLSPYAASKLAGEITCRQYTACGWVPTVSLRYFNIFGPRQDPGSDYAAVVPIFIRRLLEGQPCVIYGDGGQTRDFTFIDNVVRANLLAVEKDEAIGGAFNIGCGRAFRVLDLYRRIAEFFGTDRAPVHEPPRDGDVRISCASIDRARDTLGYEPAVGFEDGLAATCAWFRAHPRAAGVSSP
jgi:nucleoside-diphosphate-sugar epimerase